jgi:hypothetical protein
VTHILRPGKASEKTPKGVIPPSLCEISQNASRKKLRYFFPFELFGVSVTLCHSVTLLMGVTLVTYVTFKSNIIVMCHRRLPTTDFQ